MKPIFSSLFLICVSVFANAQAKSNFKDSALRANDSVLYRYVLTNNINGIDVLHSDSLITVIYKRIEIFKKRIVHNDSYPRVYLTNKKGTEYLKIWGAPDVGFGQFYTIGYANDNVCNDCGYYLGKMEVSAFVVDKQIRLGMDISELAKIKQLPYYRRFIYNGVRYFYYEKGLDHEIPFTPQFIFYFKFKEDKLIEIGLGRGLENVNPMFPPS